MNNHTQSNIIPKVSIIVPVYNTELYVERAIVSLMEQSLDNVQFIIIDDGSTDNSLNIIKRVIERYPQRKGQITLISRENRGVAATRAQGMSLASGEYVIHLDSDDWADITWLEAMYTRAIAENADVVVCDYYTVFSNKKKLLRQEVSHDNVECIKRLLSGKISNSNCDKLVRREIFAVNKINFHVGYDMGEDFLVTFLVMLNSRVIISLGKALYFYNKTNESSLTKRYDKSSFNSLRSITRLIEKELQSKRLLPQLLHEVYAFKLTTVSLYIINSSGNSLEIANAFSLYPEANSKIINSNMKLLKLFYLCHRTGCSFLCRYILRLWKKINA